MDPLPRSRRHLLTLALVSAACGHAPLRGVGASSASHPEVDGGPPPVTDAGGRGAGPLPMGDDFRRVFAKRTGDGAPSTGHFVGRYVVDVYASPPAAAALDAGAATFPPASLLVAEHREPRGERGPLFWMQKMPAGYDAAHGDWRYGIADERGRVVDEGPLAPCARCHDEAPRDHVFAAPR